MTPDFESAAARHLSDAVLLHDEGRVANAFYLAGYVAECSMKAVVQRCGGNAPAYRHQLMRLEREGLDLAIALSPGLVRYRPDPAKVAALSSRWSTERRYSASADTPRDLAATGLELARHVFSATVGAMFLDGLILEPPA